MVKSNSNGKNKDILATIGRVLFVYIPFVVILLFIISWIIGIGFSLIILVDLVNNLCAAQDKFMFIAALASIIEFGLFITMTYIITLGLYTSILNPIIAGRDIQLSQIRTDFIEKVSRPFLITVVSILTIYILEIATEITGLLQGANLLNYDEIYCMVISMVLFAIVAVIIAIIVRLEK